MQIIIFSTQYNALLFTTIPRSKIPKKVFDVLELLELLEAVILLYVKKGNTDYKRYFP